MEILIGVILVLGWLLMMVGGIWLLVMAFKESLVWGFCCLFLQIAQPIFICTHWDRSWRPLLLSLFGFATVVAAVFAAPNVILSEGEGGLLEVFESQGFDIKELLPGGSNTTTEVIEVESLEVAVGDSCEDVLRKCGKPIGEGSGKGGVVWHYKQTTITFADGETVSLIESAL